MRLRAIGRFVLAACGIALAACAERAGTTPGTQQRQVTRPDFQQTSGTGEVLVIRDGVLAALRDGKYSCHEMGGTGSNGVRVAARTFSVDLGQQIVRVRATSENDSLIFGEIVFSAGGSRHQTLMTTEEPLVGKDTAAHAILVAAASAPCGKG